MTPAVLVTTRREHDIQRSLLAVDPVERAHRVSRMRGSSMRRLREARRIREAIAQFFTDAAAWNDARPLGEAPLDLDPDGALACIADELDRWLALTTQTG